MGQIKFVLILFVNAKNYIKLYKTRKIKQKQITGERGSRARNTENANTCVDKLTNRVTMHVISDNMHAVTLRLYRLARVYMFAIFTH